MPQNWVAADSQVQGKARPRASQEAPPLPTSVLSSGFFPPLGRGGVGAHSRQPSPEPLPTSPPPWGVISPIATGLRDLL